MKNRLKALRSALKITQFELADKAKIGRSTYAMFETGQRVPKDIHISSICSATGANEEWLRNGTGDMFASSADDTIASVCEKHHFSTIEKKMLEAYVALDAKYREGVLHYVEALVASITEPDAPATEPDDGYDSIRAAIRAADPNQDLCKERRA